MQEPKPVQIDADGTRWWNYLYEYDWDGKTYGFGICARSEQEAHDRLKRLPLARYVGQGCGGPIAATGSGIFVPLIVWWRNWRRA